MYSIYTRNGIKIGFAVEINADRAVAKWLRSNARGYMACDLIAVAVS